MYSLQRIYKPIKKELAQVERMIQSQFSKEQRKLINGQGKRLRPAFLILSYKLTKGTVPQKVIKLAAGLELLHQASLIHDDIVDQAGLRHATTSMQVKHGTDVALTFGDFCFGQAAYLVAGCRDPVISELFAQAVRDLSLGQLIQTQQRNNFSLSEKAYLDIIRQKTSSLFVCATSMGRYCASGKKSEGAKLGEGFGQAFQMVDDLYDTLADTKMLGKEPAENILTGDVTLPYIVLLQKLKGKDKQTLLRLLKGHKVKKTVRFAKNHLGSSGAKKMLVKKINGQLSVADKQLHSYKPSQARESLLAIVEVLRSRLSKC